MRQAFQCCLPDAVISSIEILRMFWLKTELYSRSLSDLRLTARFLPFLPAAALPKYSRSPATLRFCRLASGKNHQKSPQSLKVRQTPRLGCRAAGKNTITRRRKFRDIFRILAAMRQVLQVSESLLDEYWCFNQLINIR